MSFSVIISKVIDNVFKMLDGNKNRDFMFLRKWFQKKDNEILKNFAMKDIIMHSTFANFFGQESKGVKQVRGNGLIVLTKDELYFEMYAPKRKFNVPLESVSKIETVKWHLKKTKSRPLLKVIYTNEKGEEDSLVWLVQDLENWLNVLNQTIFRLKK